jgi:hypothetical protein
MTTVTPGAVEVTQEREWTLWSDQRPPNAAGEYRYRATFPFLGLTVTAEWTEKMHLCGMGYSDSEWWPLSPCRWDGYNRYITINGLEWSPVQAYDPADTVWHGLDLQPCPFTGKPARLEPVGQYIGAPLWRSEAVYIWSPGVPKRRWTDAKAMQAAWNTRATPPDALQTVVEAWLPIESAPRDGTRFLAWCPYVGRAIMRIHGLHRETWAIDPSGKLGCQPTHWMPLPKPPEPREPEL